VLVTAPLRRRRVLHVVDSLEIGGVASILADVVAHTRDELDHRIVCVRRPGARAGLLAELGAQVEVLGARSGAVMSTVAGLVARCRGAAPDIVHAHNWGAVEAVFAARLCRIGAIAYQEHGPASWSGRRRTHGRRLAGRCAHAVIAVSESVRDHLVREVGIPLAKIAVIRNAVDTERFRPRRRREQLRQHRGLDPDTAVIGAVGRLEAMKHYDHLIAAFDAVAQQRSEARLVIVGDGPAAGHLRAAIHAGRLDDRIRLVGARDDVPEWLATMDVFAHPSLAEGLSLAVLQAMAVGLPVVASHLAANREAVVDGITGRLVPPHAPAALAAAIVSYCVDAARRRAHGAAGRQRIEVEFPLGRMIAAYRSLYDGLTRRAAA
jgi:sugar transferase (PEP-CTERM/EpsH1 system associated)